MSVCAGVRRAVALGAVAALCAACSGGQNALDPRGPQAARIADLWWLMFWLGTAVFVAYCVVLGYALYRAHERGEANELPPHHGRNLVLWGGLGIPLPILFVLLVFSIYTDRQLALLGNPDRDLLTIEVIGHQFWWEIRYIDPLRYDRIFRTANEIHIPVGQPVRLEVRSADVIHSIWIPNLHGKIDLVPGKNNSLVIQADEPGVFGGQCAEFCGVQHAKMRLAVVAQPAADFTAWWDHQVRPAPPPVDPELLRGQNVFMQTGCAFCHAVRGTGARAVVAPDLTHFASRRTIAAGVLPNTRGHLGAWIADPQAIKPGNFMPAVPLDSESLQALLSYLQSLN